MNGAALGLSKWRANVAFWPFATIRGDAATRSLWKRSGHSASRAMSTRPQSKPASKRRVGHSGHQCSAGLAARPGSAERPVVLGAVVRISRSTAARHRQELLRRTFEHALKAKAGVRAPITFVFNSVSQGLYIQHKLFPRCPIYNFSVEREDLSEDYRRRRSCVARRLQTRLLTLTISPPSTLVLWGSHARGITAS